MARPEPPWDDPPDTNAEARQAGADGSDPISQAAHYGVATIDYLARSVRTEGPIVFTFVTAILLLVANFALRLTDQYGDLDFVAVLVLAGVLMINASVLALFRFRAAARQTANIIQSDIDALSGERAARDKRLDAAADSFEQD